MKPQAVMVGYAQLDDRNVTTQAGYTHAAGDGEVGSRDSGGPPQGGAESLPRSPEDGSEAQPSIFLQPQVRVPPTYPRYRQRTSTVLGALQVTLALCAMIINLGVIVTIVTANGDGYSNSLLMGYALWCPVLYVISGALAIEAGKRARRRVVVGILVMAPVSAVAAGVNIYCAILPVMARPYHRGPSSDEYFFYTVKVNLALSIVLLVIGFVEFIATLTTAALGCAVACCRQYVISWALAIAAGRRARRGVVVGSLVMATISAVIAWVHIYCALIYSVDEYYYHMRVNQALSIVLLVIGFVEFIATVTTAALGCAVACCRQTTTVVTETNVVYVPDPHSAVTS